MMQPAGLTEKQLYLFIVIFRVINSITIQSYFNPDEYWQCLEVAHYDVFGYGYKTWEWSLEWKIRSYTYPAIISFMYYIFKILHIDTTDFLVYGPKLLHSIGTAITDIFVYRCTNNWFGPNPANFALLCSLLNWFIFYSLPRTFSNSLETYLTMIAFYYWPFPNAMSSMIIPKHSENRRYALIFASIACIIRITNAVIWIPLVLREILILSRLKKYQLLKSLIIDIVIIAIISISLLITIDSLYYGELTITPFNFYYFNNILNGSSLYGTHPFYWYFLIGIPTIVGTMTPSIFYGLRFIAKSWSKHGSNRKNHYALISKLMPFICCLWTVIIFSFNAHKEFRFLLPILPILMIYCGIGLYHIFITYRYTAKYVLIILIITNGFAVLYLSQFHQSAPIEVMKYLNNDIYRIVNKDKDNGYNNYKDIDIDFILPCHSTPFYSYLHLGSIEDHIELRFLECNPHFDKDEENNDQLTRNKTPSWWLEVNPSSYFKDHLAKSYEINSCPKYMVISSHHLQIAKRVIAQCQYIERKRFMDNYLENKYLVLLSNI